MSKDTEKKRKEDEDPELDEEQDEEEDEEEEDEMVNPDADVADNTFDLGYGSSTGAGTMNFGRGDLGIGGVEGEIQVRNTAGPDVNPDADDGEDGRVDPFHSGTGVGTIDGVNPDLLGTVGLGPIEPPTDDGINPYADQQTAATGSDGAGTNDDENAALVSRGSDSADFDNQISGFDQLSDAALDVGFGSGDFGAAEQDPGGGFGEPVDDPFD